MNLQHIRAAVAEIAALHAATWHARTDPELAWVPQDEYLLVAQMPGMWSVIRDQVVARQPDFVELGDGLFALYPELVEIARGRPSCIVHGDYRADNLRMKQDGSGFQFLVYDWQTYFVGMGAVDVARISSDSSARILTRTEHESLSEFWFSRLRAGGVTDYSSQEAWFDYRLSSALVTVLAAVVDTPQEHEPRLAETMTLISERILGSVLELDILEFAKDAVAQHR